MTTATLTDKTARCGEKTSKTSDTTFLTSPKKGTKKLPKNQATHFRLFLCYGPENHTGGSQFLYIPTKTIHLGEKTDV